jgi:UDP-N-acetylmuramyl pentapeptide phosphotransferase/UDP-N-acetylglucosamine-1-phosphate transferase
LVLGLAGDTEPWFLVALEIAIVVFAINAVNLFDGLDGLAGTVGLVAALGLAWLAVGRGFDGDLPLSLAAGLLGFLALGWHPARVFLGDAGAYVVGLTLAASIAAASPGSARDLLVAATLLGVFAIDLVVTVLRRLRNTRPLFEGDRSHVYDQLRDRGMGVPHVVLVAAATQAALVVITVLVDQLVPGWTGVGVLVVIWGLSVALLARGGYLSVDSS